MVGVVDPAARKKERMTHFEHTTHTHTIKGHGRRRRFGIFNGLASVMAQQIITLSLWRVGAPIPVGHKNRKAWGILVTPRPDKGLFQIRCRICNLWLWHEKSTFLGVRLSLCTPHSAISCRMRNLLTRTRHHAEISLRTTCITANNAA